MSTAATKNHKHPHPLHLALYAGGDLPFWRRISLSRHVEQCAVCASFVHSLESASSDLKHQAASETLTGFEAIADWTQLESEMSGNISVGLAAARCVRDTPKGRKWMFASLATAGLAALLAVSWAMHIPADETRAVAGKLRQWAGGTEAAALSSGPVMRASPDGIAVRTQGLTLTMRHPKSAIVSVAGNASIEARFVDEETGQVTISSVYAQ